MSDKEQKALDKLLSYLKILPTDGPSNFPVIYIKVNVKGEGVIFPEWVADKYPDNIISLAIYDLYKDLEIKEDKFIVTLNFTMPGGKENIPITIPFSSIYGFMIDRERPDPLYGREDADNVIDFNRLTGTVH